MRIGNESLTPASFESIPIRCVSSTPYRSGLRATSSPTIVSVALAFGLPLLSGGKKATVQSEQP